MGALTEMAGAPAAPEKKKGGILSTFLDVLKYGPFVGEARENRAIRMQRQQQDQQDSDLMRRWREAQILEMQTPKAPPLNDTERDWSFYQQNLTPEQFEGWKRRLYDPEVTIPLPGGTYVGPRSGLPAALGQGGGVAPMPDASGSPDLPPGFKVRTGGPGQTAPAPFPY